MTPQDFYWLFIASSVSRVQNVWRALTKPGLAGGLRWRIRVWKYHRRRCSCCGRKFNDLTTVGAISGSDGYWCGEECYRKACGVTE